MLEKMICKVIDMLNRIFPGAGEDDISVEQACSVTNLPLEMFDRPLEVLRFLKKNNN